jgi:multisubunit Na+/H+ antiporter MnhB subunit
MDTPEKRMRLVRIAFFIATFMMVLGFVLIILSLANPDLLP